tara:strand:+ start:1736 stop:2740 length:1005 start_codon:yes stop_codon:yes gene_type:complete
MKILITGGSGFIGSALIRYLLNNFKSYEILNIDKLTYAANNSLQEFSDNKNYSHLNVDITDKNELIKAFLGFKPQCVMHLAAESHVDNSIKNPDEFIKTNIIGTFNMLNCSLEYINEFQPENFRFHHISTDEVFGDLEIDDPKFTESTSYNPSSPYSASKASSDHLVRAWGRTYGLPILITNCSNNYGPFQHNEKLIPTIINNALNHNFIPIYGDGSQIRDWLYVEDHAIALHQVLKNGVINETYNIGGINEIKNIVVAKKVCAILDEIHPIDSSVYNSYEDLIKFVEDRPGHDKRYAINCSKIKDDLNWLPAEDFDSGMLKTVRWYLNKFNQN